jgi:hypothetical protein
MFILIVKVSSRRRNWRDASISIVGQRRCVDLFIKCNRCNLGEKSAVWASGDARNLDFPIGPIMTFLLRSKSYF